MPRGLRSSEKLRYRFSPQITEQSPAIGGSSQPFLVPFMMQFGSENSTKAPALKVLTLKRGNQHLLVRAMRDVCINALGSTEERPRIISRSRR